MNDYKEDLGEEYNELINNLHIASLGFAFSKSDYGRESAECREWCEKLSVAREAMANYVRGLKQEAISC